MYLKKFLISNINNLKEIIITAPFKQDNTPKPIVFVGTNGSGKTALLSFIVDAIYEIANKLFSDVLPGQGMGYQYYRMVQNNNADSVVIIEFINEIGKGYFYQYHTGNPSIDLIKKEFQNFSINLSQPKYISSDVQFDKELLKQTFKLDCFLYLPAYRFETPGWKNSILSKNTNHDKTLLSENLEKPFEIINSLAENKKFILDILTDFEINKEFNPANNNFSVSPIEAEKMNILNSIIQIIKNNKNIRFGVNTRNSSSRISLVEINSLGQPVKEYLHNLNDLSLGETAVLNIFINILRYADIFNRSIKEFKGIVVIDEIEAHLHIGLQHNVLPELIKLFPKIQFIITTHSPLFLLGMDKTFNKDGYEIRTLPSGEIITSERFMEFEVAYSHYKNTSKYESDMLNYINTQNNKPLIFVEGDYDVKYIQKAATLLEKKSLLDKVILNDGEGFGNLDKIYNTLSNLKKNIKPLIKNNKIILLYDCDTKKQSSDIENMIFKRIIEFQSDSPINKGIENLFNINTIERIISTDKSLIDKVEEHSRTVNGIKELVPESFNLNSDKKKELCNLLCESGTRDDFTKFDIIFKIIENIIGVID